MTTLGTVVAGDLVNLEVDVMAKYVERLMAVRWPKGWPRGWKDDDDERTETDGTSPFASIPEAVEDVRAGRVVIVVDDADRENEGDLIMAADQVTPEAIAFIVRHTSGVSVCPWSVNASTSWRSR